MKRRPRVKGYAHVRREEATPHTFGEATAGLSLQDETYSALGQPGEEDIILCFSTPDPGWFELVCLADLPRSCRSPEHIAKNHMREVEQMLVAFKKARTS